MSKRKAKKRKKRFRRTFDKMLLSLWVIADASKDRPLGCTDEFHFTLTAEQLDAISDAWFDGVMDDYIMKRAAKWVRKRVNPESNGFCPSQARQSIKDRLDRYIQEKS